MLDNRANERMQALILRLGEVELECELLRQRDRERVVAMRHALLAARRYVEGLKPDPFDVVGQALAACRDLAADPTPSRTLEAEDGSQQRP